MPDQAARETRAQLEQKLGLLMLNTEESFLLVDRHLKIVAFNDSFRRDYHDFFGLEVAKGKSVLAYARSSAERLEGIYSRVFAGEIIDEDIAIPGEDAPIFHLRYKPAYDENASIIGAFVSISDVTRARRTSRALEVSENKYRSIVENSFNAFILHDPEGEMLDANQAALDMFGYDNITDFLAVGRKGIIVYDEALNTLLRERTLKGRISGDVTGIRRDGTKFICEFSSSVFKDMGGRTLACSVLMDISKRKEAEKALLEANAELEISKQVYQSLFYHNFSAVFALDLKGNFTSANEVLAKKAETTVEHILTLHYSAFTHPDDLQKTTANFKKAKQGISQEYEIRIITAKGTVLSIQLINLPIVVNNEIIGVYGIANDITDVRDRQQQLEKILAEREKLNEDLVVSNNELEQFGYIASHDLQEPLRMITGFLELLEKKYTDQLDETGRKYIWFAVDGAARMRRIIDDLLDYSRVGRRDYDFELIDTNELLQEVVQLNSKLINETSATVRWGMLPNVIAARTPLEQVFQNLVTNAIKYQKPGVQPVLEISGFENEYGWQFSIADNGIGIEKNFYEKIFVIFQRLHNKTEYSGTGIGLAICKKIISNHNGKIWVKSVPGRGSTFYFTIAK